MLSINLSVKIYEVISASKNPFLSAKVEPDMKRLLHFAYTLIPLQLARQWRGSIPLTPPELAFK